MQTLLYSAPVLEMGWGELRVAFVPLSKPLWPAQLPEMSPASSLGILCQNPAFHPMARAEDKVTSKMPPLGAFAAPSFLNPSLDEQQSQELPWHGSLSSRDTKLIPKIAQGGTLEHLCSSLPAQPQRSRQQPVFDSRKIFQGKQAGKTVTHGSLVWEPGRRNRKFTAWGCSEGEPRRFIQVHTDFYRFYTDL